MINEFFYAAIKFVWRRNLYDKTLAVILLEKKIIFLAHIVECDGEASSFLPLSFDKFAEEKFSHLSLHFIFLLFKFVVTNKFNYKFLSFRHHSREKAKAR